MASKKRLLIVTNRFHPQLGGAEWNIFLQAQELSKYFEVDVFTPIRDRDPRNERSESVRITRGFNLRNLSKEYPYLKAETFCPEVFFKTIAGGYDVVHCFPALNKNNMMALVAARLRGVPVFMSNFDLVDYVSLLDRGLPVRTILDNLRISSRQAYFLAKFNAIFTISNKETGLIKAVNPNTFLSTVPILLEEFEGKVDIQEFKSAYGIEPDVPVVLCLGRVARIKGQDILLKALPHLRKKVDKFKVLFVGRADYEPEYMREMQAFIEQEGLQEHVTFTGGVPRKDVIGALKACDVHVLPVRFMNSGAVVIETWAAGKPVLQSDMIDPCYVVEGENGFTFSVDDPRDLSGKLLRILADTESRERMGANGRSLVERKFLYPQLIRQYLDAYREYGNVNV